MKQKTRLLIDRITEKEPVPEVKAGNGKQQKQDRVVSVESKSAKSEATTRQLTTDNRPQTTDHGQLDNRLQDQEAKREAGVSTELRVLSTEQYGPRTTDYRLQDNSRRREADMTVLNLDGKARSAKRSALSDSLAGRELEKKIRDRSARVGVIGLGYVGLALALEMAKAGFQVTGIDVDKEKVDSVNAGISYIPTARILDPLRLFSFSFRASAIRLIVKAGIWLLMDVASSMSRGSAPFIFAFHVR